MALCNRPRQVAKSVLLPPPLIVLVLLAYFSCIMVNLGGTTAKFEPILHWEKHPAICDRPRGPLPSARRACLYFKFWSNGYNI